MLICTLHYIQNKLRNLIHELVVDQFRGMSQTIKTLGRSSSGVLGRQRLETDSAERGAGSRLWTPVFNRSKNAARA